VPRLEVPTGRPILYLLDDGMMPLIPGGSLLDRTFSTRHEGRPAVVTPPSGLHA
jgi:hypothetical protein